MPCPNDPQKVGSSVTYGKRYDTVAMFALESVDDDGQSSAEQIRHEEAMSDLAVQVGATIKKMDTNARDELAGWVGEQGRPWPIMPRHLHGDAEWTAELAKRLGIESEAT